MSFCGACGAFAYGALRRRLGAAGVFALVFGTGAAGCLLIARAGGDYGVIVAGLAVFGVGVGLMMPSLIGVAFAASDDLTRAKAVAFVNTGIFIGESTSPFVTEPIRAGVGAPGLFLYTAVLLALLTLAFLAAALGRRARARAAQIG